MANFAFNQIVKTDTILPLGGNTITVGDASSIIIINGKQTWELPGATANAFLISSGGMDYISINTNSTTISIGPVVLELRGSMSLTTGYQITLTSGNTHGFEFIDGASIYYRVDTTLRQIYIDFSTQSTQWWMRNSSATATSNTQFVLWSETVSSSTWSFLDMYAAGTRMHRFRGDGVYEPRVGIYFWNTASNQNSIRFPNSQSPGLKFVDSDSNLYMTFKSSLAKAIRIYQPLHFSQPGGGRIHIPLAAANALMIRDASSNAILTFDTSAGKIGLSKALSFIAPGSGTNQILLTNNLTDALSIKEGSNSYISFRTTTGSTAITIAKALRLTNQNFVQNRPVNSITVPPATTTTLTMVQLVNAVVLATVNGTLQFPTPATIVAGIPAAAVNLTFKFHLVDSGAGFAGIGLNGCTAYAGAMPAVVAGASHEYLLRITNVGTPAITVYVLSVA